MKEGFLLRIPPRLKEIIAAEAGLIGISINALITQILWAYFLEYAEGGADDERR